ncbi:hypothetical protein LDO32_05450 [Luteimonas sp. Y-2-2-4F]|nr:hypothetical protein [Luteimonas sp. Y-2-2-4F]MCD9031175.1 hypothetical protein [Luteimonas sp. Y-2-2-4F]
MNKYLLSRLMHDRVDGLQSSGAYFFRSDFEYILQGVALEHVSQGLYIWIFRFPLFDFSGPNLSYSNRLPGHAFIEKGDMPEEAIVDYVMASPEVGDALAADMPMSLSEFARYLESAHLGNPHARLTYAATLVLLGQNALAAELLDGLLPILHPKDFVHCNRLRTSLRQGPEAARALLEEVRQENLRALGAA